MEKTLKGAHINHHAVGYMLNTELSLKNKNEIEDIQKYFTNEFGSAIWAAPPVSLHITLLDWLAPLVDYGKSKEELFKRIYKEYDQATSKSLEKIPSITVHFDTITIGQSAIFISGRDKGEFSRIRQAFLDVVTLLPNTKLPPTIIHSTICRFNAEIDMQPLQKAADNILIDFDQTITSFRLVKETIDPMIEFEVIKNYTL